MVFDKHFDVVCERVESVDHAVDLGVLRLDAASQFFKRQLDGVHRLVVGEASRLGFKLANPIGELRYLPGQTGQLVNELCML